MNSTGGDFSGSGHLSKKRFLLVPFLAVVGALVTGCPHNDYTVELKPKTNGVERTLIFYRIDGANYQAFPSNELAAITRIYPSGAVKQGGQRYIATGEFAGPMPNDIGGVGTCTNFATSLGEAGFYMERFRGNDDLAGKTARRFRAADQLADLVIGWTKTEFGRERGYKKLRKFLDENFRGDLKNAGLYCWIGEICSMSSSNAPEEFTARYGQYLFERGYLKLSDAPELHSIVCGGGDDPALLRLAQRLAAEKMGIPATDPLPKSFAVLNDTNLLEKSWERCLARSDLYRDNLKEWKQKRKAEPKLEAPKPLDAADDLIGDLLGGSGGDGEPDHLTVKLALKRAPNHANGKWEDGQVVWKTNLVANLNALPAVCYASWSDPDAPFQNGHFGRVILDGDELSEYCLWQSGLAGNQVHEWEAFLAGLHPGEDLRAKINAFRFATASDRASVDAGKNSPEIGSKLLLAALGKEAGANPAGSK